MKEKKLDEGTMTACKLHFNCASIQQIKLIGGIIVVTTVLNDGEGCYGIE